MNNEQLQMFFGFLVMFLSVVAGILLYRIFLMLKEYADAKKQRQNYPSLDNARQEDLCKGPHKWDQIKLSIKPLPVGEYTVCSDCGFVSTEGADFKLNKPGLEVYKNEVLRRKTELEKRQALALKRQEELDAIMNRLVRDHYGVCTDTFALQNFFRKAVIEIESLYVKLDKDYHG